jgi:simple sugar transport system permease protein
MEILTGFLEAVVRATLPLALAALGEMISQRAGFVNVGLEGAMIAGALAAAVAAAGGGTSWGYFSGALAGAGVGVILVIFAIGWRANQILTGAAVTSGALGITALLSHAAFGTTGAALSVPMSAPVAVPVLGHLPIVGRALFVQPPITWLVFALVPACWWWLARTRSGLSLRATGEYPAAVFASGASPVRLQALAVLMGSALGGLGGATLVLAQTGTFAEGMTAGRGFIALAVVALGRWHPAGVAGAALLFGATSSLQYLLQALGTAVPYQLFLALPYLLTLGVLAFTGRAGEPAWLARPLP